MTNKAGFYWHGHHNMLLERCYDPQERIDYIKKHKPADEVETRLRWMTPVEGKLPRVVIEAGKAYCKAGKAYHKAREAYYRAEVVRDKAGKAYYEARVAYGKTGIAYGKALRDHKDEIEALHTKEHPGCPWDGERLVFEAAE